MIFQHAEYASGKWFTMSLCEQMGNIGSEIERTISWRNKGNREYSIQAFYRALELLYFTIKDKKNRKRLRELTRVKEVLIDYFLFDNQYKSTDKLWQNYFYAFAYAARNAKRLQTH
ncbi:MAG TPA: hypothetical protein VHO70_07720 [Chitinispirillaceae bacterium]|nr:hypothetical protein [Chitinispirillaceae bacterium]